ncbi:NACHT domain-containing protein [Chloroflexi bacterium TSY]|nr:NACHT domain-containing protein [Chloroflexi bacterium TSY]
MLRRSGLSIEQVLARMQINGYNITRSTFENRFTTRVQQKPNVTPECLLALIAAFTERLSGEERCLATEALELANLTRLPINYFRNVQQYFPEAEFASAFEQYVAPLGLNVPGPPLRTNTIEVSENNSALTQSQNINGITQDASSLATRDLGEAPDVFQFFGRDEEVILINRWIQDEGCRLLAVLGMGGIGKTTLVRKAAEQLDDIFDYVIWRSLQNTPPIDELLDDVIRFIGGDQAVRPAETSANRVARLVRLLRNHRVLIIFDGAETILQEGHDVGEYREGYEAFQTLFQQMGKVRHESCLVMTSREKPREIALLEHASSPVRSLRLEGLSVDAARSFLETKQLYGSDSTWEKFVQSYSGNPMALMLAADPIIEVFGGDIDTFMTDHAPMFAGIRDLVDDQFSRLSLLERSILQWLAIERDAVMPNELLDALKESVSEIRLLEALRALRRRSLIEQNSGGLILQNVIMEYMTDRFVRLIVAEIEAGLPALLSTFTLLKTQSKEYIRNNQRSFILDPILRELLRRESRETVEEMLFRILRKLRNFTFW